MVQRQRSPVSVCALVSGGLDSCALVPQLAGRYRRVYPVFVRQGLHWDSAGLRALRRFLAAVPGRGVQPLTVLDFPVARLHPHHWSVTGQHVPAADSPDAAVYLPGRNLLLLGVAAVFCATHQVSVMAIGSLDHNPFPDASPEFFRAFAAVAGTALGRPIRVVAPFRRLDKAAVIRRYRHCPLWLSFSCLAPQRGRHCGRCNKCAERQRAFRAAGVVDATTYTG